MRRAEPVHLPRLRRARQGGHRHHPGGVRPGGPRLRHPRERRGGRAVALGMDNRTSSPPLKEAFAAGVLSTGVDVVDIGVNHTPLLYFATAHWKLDGGATVTGSHNPVSDNGVKMVHAGAAPLTEEEIQGLLATIRGGALRAGRGHARAPRSARRVLRRDHVAGTPRAAPQGRGGRGQRHRGQLRPRAAAPPGLRGGRALLRVRRQLPQPSARSRDGGEHPGPRGEGPRGRAPTSASPTTATPIGWEWSTSGGGATRPT